MGSGPAPEDIFMQIDQEGKTVVVTTTFVTANGAIKNLVRKEVRVRKIVLFSWLWPVLASVTVIHAHSLPGRASHPAVAI
jgi:hypothetical protein